MTYAVLTPGRSRFDADGDETGVIEVPHFDLDLLGPRALSIIGAVHPLGLSKRFFEMAIPYCGFRLHGVFEDWPSVPSKPTSSRRGGNLIVVAEKVRVNESSIQ